MTADEEATPPAPGSTGSGAGAGPGLASEGEPWRRREVALLVAGLSLAALLRLVLLPTEGLRDDLDLFAFWIHRLATDVPLGHAYDLPLTFPPLMTYIFRLMGELHPAFQTATDASDPTVRMVIKLPASVADLGIAALMVSLLRARPTTAVVAGLAIAFVPATWYVSAWWGQFEAIFTLFGLLAALLAIRGRPLLAAVALGLALSTKPQALPFIVPLAAWALGSLGPRRAAAAAVVAAVTVMVLWLPFLAAGGPSSYLANVAALQGGDYAVLSIRAWNVWWIPQQTFGGGSYFADGGALLGPLSPRLLGYVMAGLASLAVFVAVARRPSARTLLLGLAAATMASYLLLTTMHDRYSFPAITFLLAVAAPGFGRAGRATADWLDGRSPTRMPMALSVAWVILALGASANYVASAPPGGVPGSLIPIDGWVGLVGSVSLCAVGMVSLAALVLHRPAHGRRTGPGMPPGTSASSAAAIS